MICENCELMFALLFYVLVPNRIGMESQAHYCKACVDKILQGEGGAPIPARTDPGTFNAGRRRLQLRRQRDVTSLPQITIRGNVI